MNGAEVDDLDRRLLGELTADPRRSYLAIGKSLGVSGTTVATRLDRLRSAGLLRFEASPDIAAFGLTTQVFGTIQVDTDALNDVVQLLSRSPHVLRVDQVTGDFNVIFSAAFPSDEVLAGLLRRLQRVESVRRSVIHHVLDTFKTSAGWDAVFAEDEDAPSPPYEIVAGTRIPARLEADLATAATWLTCLVAGDVERLRELSTDDIVYRIVRPRSVAGSFEGLDGIVQAAKNSEAMYRSFQYRVVGVSEAHEPYTMVVDALSPVELDDGQVLTAFSRLAYAIHDGKVAMVTSIGQMDVEQLPADLVQEVPSG